MLEFQIYVSRTSALYADIREEAMSMGVESLESNLQKLSLHSFEVME